MVTSSASGIVGLNFLDDCYISSGNGGSPFGGIGVVQKGVVVVNYGNGRYAR